MKLWPGLILQGATTDQKHVWNALRYRVLAVSPTAVKLAHVDDDGEQKAEPFELLTAVCVDRFALAVWSARAWV